MRDLNTLESFVIAAETKNFSIAAERRNTVQSAISAHIRKLEDELGKTLFERGRGKSMQLTPEGHAFVVYARRILTLTDEAIDTVRNTQRLRTIRLGTTVTLAMSVIPRVLRSFAKKHRDIQIHIHCDRSDALLECLDSGDIDIAFMMDQGKRTDRLFVENMPLQWTAGTGFQLGANEDVPLAFLTDGRDLRRFAYDALDQVERKGYLAHLSPHPIGVRAFVLAGLALTVMPKVAVESPLQSLTEIDGLPSLKDIALSLYHSGNANDKDEKTLATMIRRQLFE